MKAKTFFIMILTVLLMLGFAVAAFAGIKETIINVVVDNLLPVVLTVAFGLLGAAGAAGIATAKYAASMLTAIVEAAEDKKFTKEEIADIRDKAILIVSPWRKTPDTVGTIDLKS